MESDVFPVGSRVHVTSYGPLWRQRGTIRTVHPIAVETDQPWYFYLVQLDGTQPGEPIWLAQEDVAAVRSLQDRDQ